MLPRAAKTNSYQQVASILEAEIVGGRLKIGELLPIEAELAEALGVNRSTLREGLRALEGNGLVRRVAAKRLQVTAPDPERVALTNARALGLRGASFRDLWDVQMQLEHFAAALAAERASDDQAAALRASVEALAPVLDDDEAVIRHDIAFHALIGHAAANSALELATAPMGLLLFSATRDLYRAVPAARHRLLDAHRAIADAIAARDAAGAAEWMRRHIADFRRGYEVAGFDLDAAIELRRAV
ncbi:FadR/GntR family transcriptional regulator [Paracoccus aeridis]|uniref:FadR/GntR family transcriptional regulator n=1 Tax=Paracoccus aeridis TaxID=1966466 RepID=UPI0013762AB7|nr:FCD domain-containing protein [Paracoccus aeridis]